jgi:creatinine amidohydrolase
MVRLDTLTTIEAKRGGFDKAIIPLGSCEVHGDHLPYGSDTFIAREIADRKVQPSGCSATLGITVPSDSGAMH